MDNNKYFFAVDLGATSGRTIIGTLAEGKVQLEELTRFDNSLIETGGHFYWDIFALYNEIIKGLKLVAKRQLPITSIGIDTWGVDFVCIGEDNAILRNPIAYRDPFTFEAMDEYFSKCVDKKRVYETTGIQFMNFNSLFQLYAMRRENNVALANAKKILFVPDALSWMLTGKAVCEYTIASTSQMLNPRTKDLEPELLKSVGLTREKFGMMVNPGTCIGTLTKEVQKMTGLGAIPVIAVAGHDTGSAVAAVPAKNEQFAYLSSGTWSLMGIETKDAIINEVSYERNFTNEGGIEGTTRFLKNICGMWLLDRMLAGMRAMPWLTVYGEPVAEGRYGVVSFNVNDVHPHDVATILDAGGVAVRAGHHCAQPLMEFLGIGSCCRASVAIYNTAEDVDALLENLENVRKVMGL